MGTEDTRRNGYNYGIVTGPNSLAGYHQRQQEKHCMEETIKTCHQQNTGKKRASAGSEKVRDTDPIIIQLLVGVAGVGICCILALPGIIAIMSAADNINRKGAEYVVAGGFVWALVWFAVAGWIFWYYANGIRKKVTRY